MAEVQFSFIYFFIFARGDYVICNINIIVFQEFQRSLGSKQPVYDSVTRSGRNLKDKCPKEDVPILQQMLMELKNKWNSVCAKSVDR